MNYRQMKWSVLPLAAMFLLWWFVSAGMHLKSFKENSLEQLAVLASTMQGCNYMKAQVLFSVIYLVMLYMILPQARAEHLVRETRSRWILKRIGEMGIGASYFAATFVLLQVIMAIVVLDLSFLQAHQYFVGMFLYWTALLLLYWFLGGIFLLCNLLVISKLKALALTVLISTVLMAMAFYRYIPTVYLSLDIVQLSIADIDVFAVFLRPIFWNVPILTGVLYLSRIVFLRKDLMQYENQTF